MTFGKKHFNTLNYLGIIDKVWQHVTRRKIYLIWRNLWPDCVVEINFERFETRPTEVVADILSLGKSISLEVNVDGVKKLVKEHSTELSTDELKLLQKEQKEVPEGISLEEKNGKEVVLSTLINEIRTKSDEMKINF